VTRLRGVYIGQHTDRVNNNTYATWGVSTIGTLFARYAYSSIELMVYVAKDIFSDVKSINVAGKILLFPAFIPRDIFLVTHLP